MRRLSLVIVALLLMVGYSYSKCISAYDCLLKRVVDPRRITNAIPLDHNIDAFTAYKMYKENPDKVIFVDLRTPEEFQTIGHVPWAYNIPYKLFTHKWNPVKHAFMKRKNPRFLKDFMRKFPDKNKIYIIMCRSGHRSAHAIPELVKAGYKNIYQMWEGFEGLKVPYKFAPSFGKRYLDGWRNKGLPWTYKQDNKHAYTEYELIK